MKLLVTGAAGLLGTEVVAHARDQGVDVTGTTRSDLDIVDADRCRDVVTAIAPDVVIHCAAYTAVDPAEDEPEVAMAVNRDGTRHMAEATTGVGARFVYVSTDYVFDGLKETPYEVDDATNPLGKYAESKLAGEEVTAEYPGALIARTSWVYGHARRCFASLMIDLAREGRELTVVEDQYGGPGSARESARTLLDLVRVGAEGVVHVKDRGGCSRADFADEAIRLAGIDMRVGRIRWAELPPEAPRPLYSILSVSRAEELLGRAIPTWESSLADFVRERGSR